MSECGESARLKRMAQSDQMQGMGTVMRQRSTGRMRSGSSERGFIVIVCERRVFSRVFVSKMTDT